MPGDMIMFPLGEAGCFQDEGFGDVPYGYVWDAVDLIPEILGAPWRERGGWAYQHSGTLTNVPTTGAVAPFKDGTVIVVQDGARIERMSQVIGGALTNITTSAPTPFQNPFFFQDNLFFPGDGSASNGFSITRSGASFGLLGADVTQPAAKYGCVYKSRLALANSVANPLNVWMSKPGVFTFDSLSVFKTALPVVGLKEMRNQILVFHDSSIERLIGTTPPDSTLADPTGDMRLDQMFDRAGCGDARSISSWYDQVIFCDARGIHITDGAAVKNMADQGGMGTAWRRDALNAVGFCGAVYRNLYFASILYNISGGTPNVTYVVDIASRKFWRFNNVDASFMCSFSGTPNPTTPAAEVLYFGDMANKRVVDLGRVFTPDIANAQIDGDGGGPQFSLWWGWNKVGQISLRYRKITRAGFRRVTEFFLGYSSIENAGAGTDSFTLQYYHSPTDISAETLGNFKYALEYVRGKIPVRRRKEGFSFRLSAISPGTRKDFRIEDAHLQMYEEDQRRIR